MKKILCLALLSASILGANELESKCNKSDLKTCVDLGVQYTNNGDYEKARNLWTKACNGGNVVGCDNLGFLYSGKVGGLHPNYDKAIKYYAKACNNGYAKSCFGLGEIYERENIAKALKHYIKSCNGKYVKGCHKSAELYERGDFWGGTLKVDKTKALKYYIKACDDGYALSCYTLGSLYKNGHEVKKDLSKAKKYFKKSCDLDPSAGVFGGCNEYKSIIE